MAPRKVLIERIKARGEGRIDDRPEVIMDRLKVYREETQLLIDFYRNEGLLLDIDSTKNVEDVFSQCVKALSED